MEVSALFAMARKLWQSLRFEKTMQMECWKKTGMKRVCVVMCRMCGMSGMIAAANNGHFRINI